MKDFFFEHVRIFLIIVLFYMLLYQTVFSCVLRNLSGFQNLIAILLTAIIMTSFELIFIWINYYYAFNNTGKKMIENAATETAESIKRNTKQTKNLGKGVNFIAKMIFGPASVDNKKVDIINQFANVTGLLLVFILILLLLIVKAKGAGRFNDEPLIPIRVYFTAFATAFCLGIFFGYFFFSVTSIYKMKPNEFDALISIKKILKSPLSTPTQMSKTKIDSPLMTSIFGLLAAIIIIYFGGSYFGLFNKFQNICGPEKLKI